MKVAERAGHEGDATGDLALWLGNERGRGGGQRFCWLVAAAHRALAIDAHERVLVDRQALAILHTELRQRQ